jgi:RecB family exonuclease
MRPNTFGSVVHDVLDEFGRSALKHSADPDALRQYLRSQLRKTGKRFFGNCALPTVQIQLHQIELLLDAFADVQAQRAVEGWRIMYVESPQDGFMRFPVDGIDMFIRGRIDRIDQHRDSSDWQILDYKTSANAKKPRAAHQQEGEWIDLQLPLYRHLAAELGVTGQVALGYLALPANREVDVLLADWSEAELEQADEAARQIVRNVRDQVFWPPQGAARWPEPWDDICMVGVLEATHFERN